MDSLINTGQLSHFKQQDNKTAAQCSAAVSAAPPLRRRRSGALNERRTTQRSVRELDDCFCVSDAGRS